MSEDAKAPVALSYVLLGGTAIYCLVKIRDKSLICPFVTYGVITVNSLVGLGKYALEQGESQNLYGFTSYSELLFALPCMTTTLWLTYGYRKDLSWAWTIVPCVPWLCYILNTDYIDAAIVEIIIILNVLSFGVVSFLEKNNDGLIAGVAYALSHFCLKNLAAYNVGLSFFAYFALRAIGGNPA